MPDRSSRPQARHVGPALVVLASLGIAEAAPPAGKPVAHARPARPECRPVSAIFERCHGDEWRRARGGGLRLVRHAPGQSTGYVLLPTQTGDYTRAHAVSADGRVVVGIDAALTGLWRGVKSHQFELTAGVVVRF
jgi:hypothetical protein